jgi:hypothetical protein
VENNPYTSPSTPSNEILSHIKFTELDDTSAYRIGDLFYCEAGFISPPVCFITGNLEKTNIERCPLSVATADITLYLTQQRRNKLNWECVPLGQILSVAILAVMFIASFYKLFYLLILIPPAIYYGFKIPKNFGIKTQYSQTGYIEINGAHKDFLRHFEDRGKTTVKDPPGTSP